MLALLKYLDLPWEIARGYLREDLDHIEAAINTRWAATFGNNNLLKSDTVSGDHTVDTRYVANTGPSHESKWDQVNLANGVKGRLPFPNFVQAAAAPSLVGADDAGDFQELTLGAGLNINGTTISTVSRAAEQSEALLELFRYAFTRIDFLEAVLKIEYGKNDILIPEELELLEQ